MGQQDSRTAVLPSSPPTFNNQPSAAKTAPSNLINRKGKLLQCEGLLKLQSIPFKNCIEIQTQNEILFLQNVEITLKQLLQARLNTNKLFTIEDLQKLIESVTFTLTFMQENGVLYKDVHSENIFYDNGAFKLMPNQLIALNSYQKLRDNADVYPSPQYIIALRCGEDDIVDDDIIEKNNVFMLGMILLEVATLLPSSDCYDAQTYDILDCMVNERITLVEEYYGDKVAKIIANMLDYDYTQRMNLKELSIWVNRQLNLSKVADSSILQNHNHSTSIHMSKVQQKNTLNASQRSLQKSKSKVTKNNSVYMDLKKQNEAVRQDKNRIYTKQRQIRQQDLNRVMMNEENRYMVRNHQYQAEPAPNIKRQAYARPSYAQMDTFKANNAPNNRPAKPNQIYQERDNFTLNQDRRSNNFEREASERSAATRRIDKDHLYGSNQEQSLNEAYGVAQNADNSMQDKAVLKQINMGNQLYQKDELLKQKRAEKDDSFKQKRPEKEQIKGGLNQNGSLNRIKEEILKSRKLIEQFKRSEGLKY